MARIGQLYRLARSFLESKDHFQNSNVMISPCSRSACVFYAFATCRLAG